MPPTLTEKMSVRSRQHKQSLPRWWRPTLACVSFIPPYIFTTPCFYYFHHPLSLPLSLSLKMRTLCPNLDREDGLDTVLEVPIPEEMIASSKQNSWQNMKSWMTRPHSDRAAASVFGGRAAEIQFLLGVIGAPLIPLPIRCDRTVNDNIKGYPIVSHILTVKNSFCSHPHQGQNRNFTKISLRNSCL